MYLALDEARENSVGPYKNSYVTVSVLETLHRGNPRFSLSHLITLATAWNNHPKKSIRVIKINAYNNNPSYRHRALIRMEANR